MSDTPKTDAIFKAIDRLEARNISIEDMENEGLMAALKRDHETFTRAKGAIETLANIVNGSGNNRIIRAAVVAEVIRTHRYLQQELLMTLLQAFGDLAALAEENEARWTDGRNEHIYGVFQKMVAKLGERDFYFDTPR